MRNLPYANPQGRRLAAAFIGTIFAQENKAAAKAQWRKVTEQMRPILPKLAAFMDEVEEDVLAYMDFAPTHRVKLHSTNPIERPNGEIKRRTNGPTSSPSASTRRLFVSSALSCWSRTTNGPCSEPAT